MHFQIYIPGAADLAPELEKVGLADFVGNAESLREPVGPDGKGGAVFAWWVRGCRQCGYRPDSQTWVKSAGGYWVGFWNDSLPSPDELVRKSYGKRFELGDGKSWAVPTLSPGSTPYDIAIGPDGMTRFEMPKAFLALEEARVSLLEYAQSHGCRLPIDDLVEFVTVALRINYRLTVEVVKFLKLFNVHSLFAVVNHVAATNLLEVPDGQ